MIIEDGVALVEDKPHIFDRVVAHLLAICEHQSEFLREKHANLLLLLSLFRVVLSVEKEKEDVLELFRAQFRALIAHLSQDIGHRFA